jgi:ABC-type antimicrobial peptide transport system permease subunit
MYKHYLKIAFRNMWKYKSQTLVSITGLAIGFACFAIATLWIRYEMTFDSFHKNVNRIYRVSIRDGLNENLDGSTAKINIPLGAYLKKIFPEIKNTTQISECQPIEIEINNIGVPVNLLVADSSFCDIFDISIIEGNDDFMLPANKKVAITQEKARQLFGDENPVGKTIKIYSFREYTIGAMITGFSMHSNYAFDILQIADNNSGNVIVELVPNINIKLFKKKLYEHKATISFDMTNVRGDGVARQRTVEEKIEKINIIPLTSIRYTDSSIKRNVKFQHILIFAVAGSLLILCTLFNYFTLFLSRFRIRMRELVLRVVCGASNISLFTLLSVEFLMSLTISLLLGGFIIQAFVSYFMKLSEVDIELSFIYFESLIYIVAIILTSLLVFLLTLIIFRHKTLNIAVRRSNGIIFRKASVVVQLIISIGFAFCTTIILKQMYYLHNTTDLGFSFKDRGSISSYWKGFDATVFNAILKQIPEITESIICPQLSRDNIISTNEMYDWIGKPQNAKSAPMVMIRISEKSANFYDFKLVAGEMINENDEDNYVLINELAAKVFGWNDPIGKTFENNNRVDFPANTVKTKYTIKGVIKNVYNDSPTVSANPIVYVHEKKWTKAYSVLFKYRKGTWKTCWEKISRLVNEKYPDITIDPWVSVNRIFQQTRYISVLNFEDEYDKYLKSENALLAILTVVSSVCLLVCIFGFVSMVSLTCEERRKEIAIRKINGATIKDILDIFFKEHLTLLAVGALIAFPAGYIIMKHWLEQYVIQTEMSAWVYLSIILALIMVIVMCVGGRVYKISCENPIKAINN